MANSTDADCTPKLFVISSKVLSAIPAQVCAWPAGPASENLLKVAVDSVDKSHGCLALYARSVAALCSCALQLPLTFMSHVKATSTCGLHNYTQHMSGSSF